MKLDAGAILRAAFKNGWKDPSLRRRMSDVAQGRRVVLSQQSVTSNQQPAASSQLNNSPTQILFDDTELFTDSLGGQICCLGKR